MSQQIVFNYYCVNDDCDNNELIHIHKNRSQENRKEKCPSCNISMKCVGETPAGGVAKIASMNANQRTAFFDKRASDYIKRKGNDMKREKLKKLNDVK